MPRSSPPVTRPNVDELIAVGIVRKAHGVRGEASTEPLTDSLDRFSELERVFLVSPDRSEIFPATIESWRAHSGRALVKFAEIPSPEDLRRFQNWTVEVPQEEARELEEDEYFIHDLVGLTVADAEGDELGVVVDAYNGGGGLLLEVKRPNGRKFDLPFAADICREVDLEKKKIVAAIPEGLLDLDAVRAIEDEVAAEATPVAPEKTAKKRSEQPGRERLTAPRATFDVITIFPKMLEPLLSDGILARAIEENVIEIRAWDLREFATDKHRSTDDEAYGGGAGMVMLAEPVFRCLEAIEQERGVKPHVVLMSPQGKILNQEKARALSSQGSLALLCGRYEGFDERVMELVDEEVSIGDFVVTGGELPALLVIDAVARMVEGVVGQRNSVEEDSFYNGLLDYPHYTRPAEMRGLRVPDVLLSGHAENIRKWRKEQSLRNTLQKRPELLDGARLDDEAKAMLARLRGEPYEERKSKKSLNKRSK